MKRKSIKPFGYKPWSEMVEPERAAQRQKFVVSCPNCGAQWGGKHFYKVIKCNRCGYTDYSTK
jgi:hypothetical protein